MLKIESRIQLQPKTLVAIANHGNGNRQYLDRLLSEYRSIKGITIVILSNIPKDLGPDVEVVVGVPSSNPWSLPFAHRVVFRDYHGAYDWYIYSEDDTLVTERSLEAFRRACAELECDEIAGFVRTERDSDGGVYYSTMHSFFRWRPESVVERANRLWAQYSNEHAAFFMASQEHIKRAIVSGGFTTIPHDGRHDMLCAAATDIYTACGLKRLVCLDALDDFTLAHLPNKYIGKMGLSHEEVEIQLIALREIACGKRSSTSLFEPESRLPRGAMSKNLYAGTDDHIMAAIPASTRTVLSIGCGNGALEAAIQASGRFVTCLPVDAVLGASCEWRGMYTLNPSLQSIKQLDKVDCVILVDVIHLVDDPQGWLEATRAALRLSGTIIIRSPNLGEYGFLQRFRKREQYRGYERTRESTGVHFVNSSILKRMLYEAGFHNVHVHTPTVGKRAELGRLAFGLLDGRLAQALYGIGQA